LAETLADAPTEVEIEEPTTILLAQQDMIEIARDHHCNLVIRQDRDYVGEMEVLVNRDYEAQFLDALSHFLGVKRFP
jgi:hypothetical protein